MSSVENSSENREIDLLGYLPGFLSEFRELKAVFSAETPELSEIKSVVRAVREASFIGYCGIELLPRFEKMLGIYGTENDDISERRRRVLIRWNEAPPYTVSALNSKLTAICGEGSFSIRREPDKYKITIFTNRLQSKQLDELLRMLSIFCPANLIVKVESKVVLETRRTIRLGGLSVYSAVIGA